MNHLNEIGKTEPVRVAAALQAFGVAVISLIAFLFSWVPDLIILVNGVWTAFMTLVFSFTVSNRVTSNYTGYDH